MESWQPNPAVFIGRPYFALIEFNDAYVRLFGGRKSNNLNNLNTEKWIMIKSWNYLDKFAYLSQSPQHPDLKTHRLISIQMHTENQKIEHIQSNISIIIMVIIRVLKSVFLFFRLLCCFILIACQKQKPSLGCSQAKPVPLAPSRLSQPVRLGPMRGSQYPKTHICGELEPRTQKGFSEAPRGV